MSGTTATAALFKPKPSRIETKADATTTAARAIIDSEAAARAAKTEKLRAARLAAEHEADAGHVGPTPSGKIAAAGRKKTGAAASKKAR